MLAIPHGLRCGKNCYAPGLAGFAPFRFILELFIVKEGLFPGGKHEIRAAIDAAEYLVLKLH
jgi:hypothetical protein